MPTQQKDVPPIHVRAKAHIMRTAGVCDEWCRSWRFYDRLLPTAFLFGVLVFLIYYLTIAPPIDFEGATLVKVPRNQSLESTALELERQHVIRSPQIFIYMARAYGAATSTVQGEYFFPSAQSVLTVARRMSRGDFELIPIKVTIPEGVSTRLMANILNKKIPDFDKQGFLDAATPKEGYLFPDTYFFVPGEDPLEIVSALESNFKRKLNDPIIFSAIATSGMPISDIITMASLLEKEANDYHSRQVIAGILWKRIAIHMPLQVDAVFPYIIGKNSLQLTHADLRTVSPYNTYINKGLPPGPIANPGLDSILAAVTPIQSKYLFYLSDLQGNFHYSVTYPEHLANQRLYLK